MEITKLYTKRGLPFAVEVSKDGKVFETFVESLLCAELIDPLIESGWEIRELPLGIYKGENDITSIPTEEWPLSRSEQCLWDNIGTELPVSEVRARMTTPDLFSVTTSESTFAINTREELISYLNNIKENGVPDDDFYPLNYFVNPEALWTSSDFYAGTGVEYKSIICSRRDFTYGRYTNFLSWAFEKGLKRDFAPIDLMDFYFQWGVDGVKPSYHTKEIKKVRIEPGVAADLGNPTSTAAQAREFGLMTKTGEILVPPSDSKYAWCPSAPANALSTARECLKADEVFLVNLYRLIEFPVIYLNGNEVTIDQNQVIYSGYKDRSIIISSPYDTAVRLNPKWWNPSSKELLKENQLLYNLAYAIKDRVTMETDASSYQTLLRSGCSPFSALTYMVAKDKSLDDGDDVLDVENIALADLKDSKVIMQYLKEPESVSEEVRDYLTSAVEGDMNIDCIHAGQQQDLASSVDTYYACLYAARNVLGVPAEEMIKAVQYAEDGLKDLVFKGRGYTLCIPIDYLNNKVKGYNADIFNYRYGQATQCATALYVTKIARELTTRDNGRDVAIECLKVVPNTEINNFRSRMEAAFCQRVEENIIGFAAQAENKRNAPMWAWSAYFAMCENKPMPFHEVIGGGEMVFSEADKAACRFAVRCAETCMNVSEAMISGGGSWLVYVANAVVTPTKVLPRKGFMIPRGDLLGLWANFSSTQHPAQWAKLSALGYTIDFRPFTNYTTNAFTTDIIYDETSLCNYYSRGYEEYIRLGQPQGYTATHPSELYNNEDDMQEDWDFNHPTPLKLSMMAMAFYKEDKIDMWQKCLVPPHGITSFYRYEPLDYLLGNISTQPERSSEKTLVVVDKNTLLLNTGETKGLADVPTLMSQGYPIVLVRGDKYLLKDIKDKMYVAKI